ncbi:DUF6069 family protein [Streptacidiphilus sp. EB129]|uniref:DUF6069 family protein n=1 Tax=Streptacidiphilus sp. EB129 TaxID=3156262 RepID=UPI003517F8D9
MTSPTDSMSAPASRSDASPTATLLARRPAWQVCYLSALAACVAVEACGLLARAAGVPMRAAGLGSQHATSITVGMFAMGTMIVTFWFTFAVILIARVAKRPARTYLRTALPLLALSLVVPLTAADTAVSTRLTLALAHVIAGAIIIPTVARRLPRARS